MKYLKILGLAAVAAMALTAFMGAGTASATGLWKYTTPSENDTLGVGTTITASLEAGTSAVLRDTGGLANDTCIRCRARTVRPGLSHAGPGISEGFAGVHRSGIHQEAVMKSMARAILFTSIVAATGAAVGDMLSTATGEPDKQAPESSMQSDPQASDSTMVSAESTAMSTEGAAADLAASSTYAVPQPSDSVTVTPSPSPDITAAAPPPPESVRVAPPPPPAESVARRMPARVAYQVTMPSAFPSSTDDAGRYLIASRTHADIFANTRVASVTTAFPTSTDDAGRYLIASRTHADIFLPVRFAQTDRRGDSSGN